MSPCGNDTIVKAINFNCSAPSAYYYITANNMDVSVANASGGATSYSWNFGDGFTSTETSLKHTYYASGTYSVCVTATNGCGSNTYCNTVNVTCAPPTAQFTQTLNGLTCYFVSQSTGAYNVLWHFGDGSTSNLLTPSHTYNNSGTYDVVLTVSNFCGIDSMHYTLNLVCSNPVPAFTFDYDGLTAQFQNNSTSATSYHWTFGDGKFSFLTAPTHIYKTTGKYNVCLKANNGCGSDSICDSISVCTPPSAHFIPGDSALFTSFTNASLNATSFYWTFGDGNGTNVENPTHKYVNPGTYNVCLNVSNSCGTDQICKNVTTSCSPYGAPDICLVTVDSTSTNNIVYWDKTLYTSAIDSFIIYREIANNKYAQIGAVGRNQLSMFVDTVRAKYYPNTGDPNTGTYRYKIQMKDSCGGYSALSKYHNTIFVLYGGLGQFYWTQNYSIEGGTNPVNNYVLTCDSNKTKKWDILGSISGTQSTIVDNVFTDKLKYPNARWRIETQWSIACTPTLKTTQVTVTKSISNIKSNLNVVPNGIATASENKKFSVYPNPANDLLNISIPDNANACTVEFINILGATILKQQIQGNAGQISLSAVSNGIYHLRVTDNKTSAVVGVQKVVVAK